MLKRIGYFVSIMILVATNALAIETKAKQAYLIDYDTGKVLFAKNEDERMAPSSMSKLMTCYVVFDALKTGELKKDSTMNVSENAWKMQGSKTFLPLGSQVKVEDLIRGLVVQSGNDATVVLAEGMAGTEDEFANRLNNKAKELGMNNSSFKNSSGWPHPEHLTTAKDLAILAQRLVTDFPEYYGYFAETEFTFNNITQGNRNTLLGKNLGVDGLKTGHTDIGGYGVVISATKDGRRLILVINGLDNQKVREQEAQSLLNYGFMNFTNVVVAKANTPVSQAKTWLAAEEMVNLVAKQDIIVTVAADQKKSVTADVTFNSPICAPIFADLEAAKLHLTVGEDKQEFALYADHDISQVSFFQKIWIWIKALFTTGKISPAEQAETVKISL